MKKAIIALISLLIFCIVFPSTVSAESARSHYKPRLTAPSSDNAYYNSKLNRYSQTGYGMPNCVAYAYGRVYEMNGKAPKITHGNAGDMQNPFRIPARHQCRPVNDDFMKVKFTAQ